MHAFLMVAGAVVMLVAAPKSPAPDFKTNVDHPYPPTCVVVDIKRHGPLDYEVFCEGGEWK